MSDFKYICKRFSGSHVFDRLSSDSRFISLGGGFVPVGGSRILDLVFTEDLETVHKRKCGNRQYMSPWG